MCQAVGGKGQITGLPEARRYAQPSPVPSPAMSSCQEDSDTQKALLDRLGPRVGGKTKTKGNPPRNISSEICNVYNWRAIYLFFFSQTLNENCNTK